MIITKFATFFITIIYAGAVYVGIKMWLNAARRVNIGPDFDESGLTAGLRYDKQAVLAPDCDGSHGQFDCIFVQFEITLIEVGTQLRMRVRGLRIAPANDYLPEILGG